MNKTFLTKIKALLLAEKEAIVNQAGHQDVDVDTEGDETDEIQANQLIEMNNALNARNNAKLSQITAALKRIEDKTYGKCQDCEEPIAEKRLLHNPHFLICVSCAEDREAEEKQRKKF